MSASAQMAMVVKTSSMFLELGKKSPDENRPSIATPTRLCVAAQHQKLCCSCCPGSAAQFKQSRGLELRRFPRNDVTTSVLDLKCLRTERRCLIWARRVDHKGPSLNRNEVVELLSDAVQTLLKPENQKRLRERLEKRKQRISLQRSKLLEQPSNVDQLDSPAPTSRPQDLEVGHSEMDGDTIDSGRTSSGQAFQMTTSVAIPITSQMTELVESEEQPRSIETLESPTESVEGKEGSSLTSIRRLKVLDVHSYVHKALRESALRSWLNSRTIEE